MLVEIVKWWYLYNVSKNLKISEYRCQNLQYLHDLYRYEIFLNYKEEV